MGEQLTCGSRLATIDTAQNYTNEPEAGIAIRECGIPRDKIFVTTKWSALNGLDIATSFKNSLKNVSNERGSARVVSECSLHSSSGLRTLTYTSSTDLNCAMISQSAGKTWRRSRNLDWRSPYYFFRLLIDGD